MLSSKILAIRSHKISDRYKKSIVYEKFLSSKVFFKLKNTFEESLRYLFNVFILFKTVF